MMIRWFSILSAAVLAGALSVNEAGAQTKATASRQPTDEFFIISSVDSAKNQLLLKRPTEVTEVMRVDGATAYHDENGTSIKLVDFRAGDTVYVTSTPGQGGALARQIRKGPMTVAELERRYLR
jgi:hypothetical protein